MDGGYSRAAADLRQWHPAPAPRAATRWRLERYDTLDAHGAPAGDPLVAVTPQGEERRFPSAERASWAAAELNKLDGLA